MIFNSFNPPIFVDITGTFNESVQSVERAIRQLRRRLDRDGLKERIRELEFYEKPTARRKRMKAAAQKRRVAQEHGPRGSHPCRGCS